MGPKNQEPNPCPGPAATASAAAASAAAAELSWTCKDALPCKRLIIFLKPGLSAAKPPSNHVSGHNLKVQRQGRDTEGFSLGLLCTSFPGKMPDSLLNAPARHTRQIPTARQAVCVGWIGSHWMTLCE